MKRILLMLVLQGVAGWLPAQMPALPTPQWMRYPAIAPDGQTIAFVYGGDIYTVPATGGDARLLAGGPGYEFMPVWSHDGKRIAYASDRAGNFDVYVRPLSGGPDLALTYHAADEFPFDFSANDSMVLLGSARVELAQSRQFPLDEGLKLFAVPSRGGRTRQLLSTPMADVRVGAGGKQLLYEDVKTRENRWRKHQTGPGARDIWLYDLEQQVHQQVSFFAGEDRSAVFAPDGKHIYYLSERGGSFNVYQQSTDDTLARAVTAYRDQPVRFLSIARNGTLCYGYAGQLYIKPTDKEPIQVSVNPIPRQDAGQQKRSTKEVTEMAVAPSGREIAFIAAGEVFVMTIANARVRQVTFTVAPEAGIGFSPDGKQLIYATARNQRWEIMQATAAMTRDSLFVTATSISEQLLISSGQDNTQPQWSPRGREIAYIENRQTLKVFNIQTRQSSTILAGQLISEGEQDQYFRWSPDGRWLLVQFPSPGNGNQEVGVVNASGEGGLVNLSQSGFDDSRPSWQMNGRLITWLSDREGLHGFGRSGKRQLDVYGVFPWANDATINGQRVTDGKIRLTTAATLLSDALLSKDGRQLYFLAKTMDQFDLWCTDLQKKETKKLCALNMDAGSLQWDAAQQYLYVLADGAITQVDARAGSKRAIPVSVAVLVDLPGQRQYMFDHVWRHVSTSFYTKGWHGANWPALRDLYTTYLYGIYNNYDFAELLNEMLGELNVSHTGVTYKKVGATTTSTAADSMYHRWVQRNRDEVYKASGGRIGYVHLYRMNDAAYRQVVEEVLGKMDSCAALIVDTRYNRGGNLALELEAFLSGVTVRNNANDRSRLSREPVARWTKPTVVLANEANYSDGHCFVYDYRLLHMGTLIGMPVPGSCTWQSAHALIDPTLNFAVPVMGVKDRAGRYLENQATHPDIAVRNDYRALEQGRDQQLEAAIQTVLRQMEQ